ncbi:MAG: RT0821/Lpp0805 family surface protein [Methylocystis sp.]
MPSSPRGEGFVADASDVTGSIRKPSPELARGLDVEDKRRAGAALATALDPQSEGAGVDWDNPRTGAKGIFTPVGHAYPIDGKICRAFLAEVATKDAQEHLQGTACREKTVEWTLLEVRPWKRG